MKAFAIGLNDIVLEASSPRRAYPKVTASFPKEQSRHPMPGSDPPSNPTYEYIQRPFPKPLT